jgi:hypothetical protein
MIVFPVCSFHDISLKKFYFPFLFLCFSCIFLVHLASVGF